MISRANTLRVPLIALLACAACAVRDTSRPQARDNASSGAAVSVGSRCDRVFGGKKRKSLVNRAFSKQGACKCSEKKSFLKGEDCGDLQFSRYFTKADAESLSGKRCGCGPAACGDIDDVIAGAQAAEGSGGLCECPGEVPFQCQGDGELQEVAQGFYVRGHGGAFHPWLVFDAGMPKGACSCKKPMEISVGFLDPDACSEAVEGATMPVGRSDCTCPMGRYLVGKHSNCKKFRGHTFPAKELRGKGCECGEVSCNDVISDSTPILPWERWNDQIANFDCRCKYHGPIHVGNTTGSVDKIRRATAVKHDMAYFSLDMAWRAGCSPERTCSCPKDSKEHERNIAARIAQRVQNDGFDGLRS